MPKVTIIIDSEEEIQTLIATSSEFPTVQRDFGYNTYNGASQIEKTRYTVEFDSYDEGEFKVEQKGELVFSALSEFDGVYLCMRCTTHMNLTQAPIHAVETHNQHKFTIKTKGGN